MCGNRSIPYAWQVMKSKHSVSISGFDVSSSTSTRCFDFDHRFLLNVAKRPQLVACFDFDHRLLQLNVAKRPKLFNVIKGRGDYFPLVQVETYPGFTFSQCHPQPDLQLISHDLPNAFILFRSATQGQFESKSQTDRSADIAEQWRSLDGREKKKWHHAAEKARIEHAEAYPGYKYQPGKRGKGGRKVNSTVLGRSKSKSQPRVGLGRSARLMERLMEKLSATSVSTGNSEGVASDSSTVVAHTLPPSPPLTPPLSPSSESKYLPELRTISGPWNSILPSTSLLPQEVPVPDLYSQDLLDLFAVYDWENIDSQTLALESEVPQEVPPILDLHSQYPFAVSQENIDSQPLALELEGLLEAPIPLLASVYENIDSQTSALKSEVGISDIDINPNYEVSWGNLDWLKFLDQSLWSNEEKVFVGMVFGHGLGETGLSELLSLL